MWIQAIITADDLAAVLHQLLPLKIHFDNDPSTNRWLYLDKATDIELVSGRGLRVACPAEIKWSIAGVSVPIKLHSLRLVLCPEVVSKDEGDVLAFRIELEETDFKGIPALLDRGLMSAIGAALASKDLAWNFTQTLTRRVHMPSFLDPIESLSIRVGWGKCRVDNEALALVLSFGLTFDREDDSRRYFLEGTDEDERGIESEREPIMPRRGANGDDDEEDDEDDVRPRPQPASAA